MMQWMLFFSTSSCALVRAVAGTPAVSATINSILRPASVLSRSLRNIVNASSISMPPVARGLFGSCDNGLLQHLKHSRRVLVAQPHRHRRGIDGLRQRKQRGCAANVIGKLGDNSH